MSTATLADAESTAMARATAAYYRVVTSEWPGSRGDKIREALDGLTGARDTYYDLITGRTHPASAYPELEHDDEAYARALEMAVQDAEDWAGELDRLVPADALKVGGTGQ